MILLTSWESPEFVETYELFFYLRGAGKDIRITEDFIRSALAITGTLTEGKVDLALVREIAAEQDYHADERWTERIPLNQHNLKSSGHPCTNLLDTLADALSGKESESLLSTKITKNDLFHHFFFCANRNLFRAEKLEKCRGKIEKRKMRNGEMIEVEVLSAEDLLPPNNNEEEDIDLSDWTNCFLIRCGRFAGVIYKVLHDLAIRSEAESMNLHDVVSIIMCRLSSSIDTGGKNQLEGFLLSVIDSMIDGIN